MTKKFIAMFMLFMFMTATALAASENEDWENGFVSASGTALGPQGNSLNGHFYRNYARQAARLEALRNLAEIIGGIWVETNTDIVEMNVVSDQIITYLDTEETVSFYDAQQVGETKFTNDGVCEVVVQMRRFGKGSVAESVISHDRNNQTAPIPKPKHFIKTAKYTGLIIDCRDLKLIRNVKAEIKTDDDLSIYTTKYLDYDKVYEKVINQGMVTYTKDIKKQTRAGKNPLVVKALKMDFNDNAIISNEDADKILSANQSTKFLENAAIVFVY